VRRGRRRRRQCRHASVVAAAIAAVTVHAAIAAAAIAAAAVAANAIAASATIAASAAVVMETFVAPAVRCEALSIVSIAIAVATAVATAVQRLRTDQAAVAGALHERSRSVDKLFKIQGMGAIQYATHAFRLCFTHCARKRQWQN
jgi:hypothetical protein